MTESVPIRVLLADDHPLVLEGISSRLGTEAHLEVVGLAHNGQEALELAAQLRPDVVMMDVSMPVMNGLEATQIFQQRFPSVRVLILSMHDNREYILQLIRAGASGYILKDVSSDELIKAIETVHQGGTYFSASASQSLFSLDEASAAPMTPSTPDPDSQPLTPREETVLRLLAEGGSNKDIARTLDISVRTVETHRQNIKTKLNIQTAAGLTRFAIEQGLVELK
ncbi:response regulator transcription factor [Marinobacterium sedimentorum]|uniref:response regulator transcription factor n=1 Tax=Marinobacterium sedimentorum TaxID=2927804 RepID=UPI0020C6023F|nr:response regulator transcription factor [Marinobacterium sedimentorum]MCP8689809.1 response regulator transcription factor [Marinobacterium sedimentorum]